MDFGFHVSLVVNDILNGYVELYLLSLLPVSLFWVLVDQVIIMIEIVSIITMYYCYYFNIVEHNYAYA